MKLKTVIATCALALTLSAAAHAGSPSGAHQHPADNSSPELKRIKSLEGRWTGITEAFGKPQRMVTEYEVTSGGAAVLERIFPGTPHEMVSVYYDDNNGKLAMTHYCMMRNRPTLKLSKSTDDAIVMKVSKVEGLKSKNDPQMGNMTIAFKGKNKIATTCGGKGPDGKEMGPMTTELTRIR